MSSYPSYNWGAGNTSSPGTYVERIGGNSFFPFRIMNCVDCSYYPYGPYGSLACYSDDTYSIRLRTAIPCDSLMNPPPLAVQDRDLSDDNILLYPIPGNEECHLVFRRPLSAAASIQLYDLSGRSIWAGTIQPRQSSLLINTAALPGGIYLLRIRKDNATGFRKLVVVH